MGHLSTHVLDTMNGCPAAGLAVTLERLDGEAGHVVLSTALNADGRALLLDAGAMAAGRWRIRFAVGDYFRGRGVALPDPAFIDSVPVEFGIADAGSGYHVPLLVSPWAYSTYRGS